MIRMNNIRQEGSVFSMDVVICDRSCEHQKFFFKFDLETDEILSDISFLDDGDLYYASHAISKIRTFLREGEPIPDHCVSAWY